MSEQNESELRPKSRFVHAGKLVAEVVDTSNLELTLRTANQTLLKAMKKYTEFEADKDAITATRQHEDFVKETYQKQMFSKDLELL